MKKTAYVLTACFLSLVSARAQACWSEDCANSTATFTAEGRPAYMLTCPSREGWNGCANTAQDLCGAAGYTVVEKYAEPYKGDVSPLWGGIVARNPAVIGAGLAQPGPLLLRDMLITCGGQ